MKVKDLKKYIDDYIAKHSENDDVVFGYDCDDEFQVSSFSKRNLKSSIMTTVKEQYIKTCGWEYDCHTPGKPCLEYCKHCSDGGGIGYRNKTIFRNTGNGNPMYGHSVTEYMSDEEIKSWKDNLSKNSKGRKHMYNPNTLENRFVKPKDFDKFIKLGFVFG